MPTGFRPQTRLAEHACRVRTPRRGGRACPPGTPPGARGWACSPGYAPRGAGPAHACRGNPPARGASVPTRATILRAGRACPPGQPPRGAGRACLPGQPPRGAGNCATSRRRAARRHRPEGAVAVVSGPPAGGRLLAQFPAPLWGVPRQACAAPARRGVARAGRLGARAAGAYPGKGVGPRPRGGEDAGPGGEELRGGPSAERPQQGPRSFHTPHCPVVPGCSFWVHHWACHFSPFQETWLPLV